jgi:hypothetical protein
MPPEPVPEAERRAILRHNLMQMMFVHDSTITEETIDIQRDNVARQRFNTQPFTGGSLTRAALPKITVPTLGIFGARDNLSWPDVSVRVDPCRELMPAMRIELIPDAGHWVQYERPEPVNRLLIDSMDASRYVTAVYGILEAASGRFTYMNCGQTPPLLVRAAGATVRLDQGGPALGMPVGGARVSASVQLDAGDILALYTDGVVEVFAESGDEFGVGRLERVLRATGAGGAGRVIREVVDATRSHAGRVAYDDDFTLVVVRRTAG